MLFAGILICATCLGLPSSAWSEGVRVSYLYKLSDFFGPEPLSWPQISADPAGKEIYVTHQNSVRIFDENGMEMYRFGDDEGRGAGSISDAAADDEGNIVLLTYEFSAGARRFSLVLCNYRGEPRGKIELKGMPADFTEKFFPDSLVYRDNRLYLCDSGSMKVVVSDKEGKIERTVDIQKLLKARPDRPGQQMDLAGFNVDGQGNLLFTVSVLFRAFRLSPEGVLTGFGQRGSSPGKFNVASGIAADDQGYYYVSDRLKCAVLVFDKDLNYVLQFGYRGYEGDGLIVPAGLLVSGNRLYVTQAASMGVSVFRIEH